MAREIPTTMRAWYHESPGTPAEVLKFTTTFTTPRCSELASEDVLVKIAYCAITPGISMMMPLEPAWLHKMPAIPELEFSGTVVSLGSSVALARPDLALNAPVFGVTSMKIRGKQGFGTLAEYCPCPMQRLIGIPINMSLAEAAGLGGNGITALQALDLSNLGKGDKVLINGGSGGTGSMMIQCAKAIVGEEGCVVSTSSDVSFKMLKELGADKLIDYRRHDPLHTYLLQEHSESPFDVIVDTVGVQSLYSHCPGYLRENGRFINIGGMQVKSTIASLLAFFWSQLYNAHWPAFLGGTPRWFRMLSGTPDLNSLSRVKDLAEHRLLKSVIDSTWEMQDALKAYEKLASKRSKGKVLIRIED
ncbi:zinc ion binding [Aspergillus nanangensis]|uniref:Zinc ion binding n=1 Tax=Aspergillus nanangensis TaxID=2582783 RepID=A0AAD4CTZ3_ASPNN|nr:zinc ion binding [Aspergillus nanangensis]